MEALAPPLRLVQVVRYHVECGESVRQGLKEYLNQSPDDFREQILAWLQLIERGCCTQDYMRKIKSTVRRQIITVLERGVMGDPILPILISLEEELVERSLSEIESFLGQLPFRMMLPLLFFLFPAYLVLLLGPLLMQINSGIT